MTAPRIDPNRTVVSTTRTTARAPRWLLFVHQLPSTTSNLRVRTWRRMQQIGALPIKQALYVLPDLPVAREDFEWLKTEIEAAGGHASVFAADAVDAWSNDALIDEFRRSRQQAYDALAGDAEKLLKRPARRSAAASPARLIQQLKERFATVERIDFFGSAGRDRVFTLIQQLEAKSEGVRAGAPRRASGGAPVYKSRHWVTRPRPGIDRIASAWLIRKFIDREARFGFVADRDAAPRDAVPFDMFGVEFTHRGDLCTFEVLCETFGLSEAALGRIARIVHDLDLKDGRFGATEAPTIGLLVDGLRLAHADDAVVLAEGMSIFEALYRGTEQADRLQGPRPVTRRRAPRAQAPRARKGR
jgi:hypothetical protein